MNQNYVKYKKYKNKYIEFKKIIIKNKVINQIGGNLDKFITACAENDINTVRKLLNDKKKKNRHKQ